MEQLEDQARVFLGRFLEEFPAPAGPQDPLPLRPLSPRTLHLDELPGESLELGLRLLATRNAPAVLSVLLCQAALAELLTSDLSPFHCTHGAGEEEEEGPLLQSEQVQRVFLTRLWERASALQRQLPALPAPGPWGPCSAHAIRNTRRKMEDKHVCLPEFSQLLGLKDGMRRGYYAVFDGHGGADAAAYAAAHLHVALGQQGALSGDPEEALRAAFSRLDGMFQARARRERLRSGSTAVVVLLQEAQLTVAWLGDSQALLVRQGVVVALMEPHKPEREDEKQRIEDLGGLITYMGCWRVNGTYAVSRAIGDYDQRPYVSGEADCSSVPLQGGEDYMLLACDGFFDAVKPAEVPQLVLEALWGEGGEGVALGEGVAQRLVAHAREAGSDDNITVVVVFLRPPQELLLSPRAPAVAIETAP